MTQKLRSAALSLLGVFFLFQGLQSLLGLVRPVRLFLQDWWERKCSVKCEVTGQEPWWGPV